MLISSPMKCRKCGKEVGVKVTSEFITIKCRCKCVVHNKEGEISVIPAEEYKKNYKKGENNNG